MNPKTNMMFRKVSRKRRSCKCKENLKNNLVSLIAFCKNLLNMQIAIVGVDKNLLIFHELSNKVQRSAPETVPAEMILSPSHVQAFKIRSKKHSETYPQQEIINIPLERKPETVSNDIFGILTKLRSSFFAPIFNTEENDKIVTESSSSPDMEMPPNQNLKLLNKVVQTFEELQDEPDEPFLLIVFGGNLKDVKNCNSALMQSIKFISDTVNCGETLILLTGTCPEDVSHQHRVPVFAKGPLSGLITQCTQLEDIPLVIKNGLLASDNFNDDSKLVRKKRYLLNIRPNKPRIISLGTKITYKELLIMLTTIIVNFY